MRKHGWILFFILTACFCFAQEGENPLPYVAQKPKFDTAPRYPGGDKAMKKFFEDSIRYPEPEKTKSIQGSVSIKFDVTKKGKVCNVKLINGVPGGPNLAKEAVRVMQTMPLWIPATKNKKPVTAEYYLHVPFVIRKR